MAPPKRRKVYLDPGSSARVPKATKWRLETPSSRLPATATTSSAPQDSSCDDPCSSASSSPEHNYEYSDASSSPEASCDEDCDDEQSQPSLNVPDGTPTASPLGGDPHENHSGSATAEMSDCFDADYLGELFIEGGTLTRGDAFMLLLDMAIKHGLSWTTIESIQRLFNNLLGKKAFPESKYLFKKFCGLDMKDIVFHFYCADCMALLAKTTTPEERKQLKVMCSLCKKEYMGSDLVRSGSFFVSLPLEKQLSSVLSSKSTSNAVLDTLERAPGDSMRDITDGQHYHATRSEVGMAEHDLTLTLNSDGSPIFQSSKFSIWPVQVIINELPPLLRWKNVVVPLLWYGKDHPNMTLLLQAFVDQLEKLNISGITWSCGDRLINSKVYCICCCADAPARAAMQHVIQFNGYYGCSWCYHPGENVNGTVKYTISQPFHDRSDEEALLDMEKAVRTGTIVRGVKGPSPLINLPGFSTVWAWCPDYMHCILLGVTRQITELWFSEVGADFYCGRPSSMAVLNDRLCSVKVPGCINRRPRSLKLRKYWKASEWQYWLLYYSVPCLTGVLGSAYLDHWALLVAGVFLLLKDSVTQQEIDESTKLLTEFVVRVQFIYGPSNMTYNVHQLLHVPKSVVLFGPLWAHSCFTFETNSGRLMKLVTSSNGVALQIATRLLLQNNLSSLKAVASEKALELCLEKPPQGRVGGIIPLGKCEELERSFLEGYAELRSCEGAVELKRILLDGATIASEKYLRHKRIDCTAVCLSSGSYLKAQRLICAKDKTGHEQVYALSFDYVTEPLTQCRHLKAARKSTQKLFRISEHARPCIHLCSGSQEYFCDLVNNYEWS